MTSARRAVLAALVLSIVAAASARADLADIKKRGSLKVIAVKEEAPEMFSFAATGEPGFEREIIEGFARLQGLKMDVVQVPTSGDRIPALNKGDGEVIIGIIATDERKKLVDFTSEVLPARHLAVTLKPHKAVATVEELKAEKVGVVKGTSWAAVTLEAGVPEKSIEYFPDRYAVFEALKAGKVTATVMSLSDFTLAAKKNPSLQGGVFIGPSASASFAVKKGDAQLLAALNQYLENMRSGPSWSRLVVKYFGEQALAVLGRAKK